MRNRGNSWQTRVDWFQSERRWINQWDGWDPLSSWKQFKHRTSGQLTEFEPIGTGTEGGECTCVFMQQLIRLFISGLQAGQLPEHQVDMSRLLCISELSSSKITVCYIETLFNIWAQISLVPHKTWQKQSSPLFLHIHFPPCQLKHQWVSLNILNRLSKDERLVWFCSNVPICLPEMKTLSLKLLLEG